MLDPTGAAWSTANPTKPQAFFSLVWEQLCGGSVLDSWQFRAMNLPALLEEVIEICTVARSFQPVQRALPDVFDEAVNVSQRDPVLHGRFRAATSVLRDPKLSVLKDPKLREETPEALLFAEHTALHLLDTLRAYPRAVGDELTQLLSQADAKQKHDIAYVANALATELHIRGFSREYLLTFAERLALGNFGDTLGELIGLLDRPVRTYRCTLPVSWPASFADIHVEGATIHAALPDVGTSMAAQAFRSMARPELLYFVVEVAARDEIAAAQLASLAAARIRALASFYAPNKDFEIERRKMLVQTDTEAHLTELDLAHEQYIRDSSRPADKLKGTSPRVTELLAAALQYHALGVQADAPESRLTNFWVALESLLVDHSGSIIQKVTNLIPPSIALSRSSRILVALGVEIARFGRQMDRNDSGAAAVLRTYLGAAASGRIRVEPSVLVTMLMDDAKASQLFALVARNPLLVYRLNQTRDQLRSPSDMRSSLEKHRQGVSWQISRIYRARNSLVHRGKLPRGAEHLIQHLHTYLSMTLHYLVREIGDSPFLTVDAAFARRRALYDVYLSKFEDRTMTIANLLEESTCWHASADPVLWPPPPAIA